MVDHAIFRAFNKGALGILQVEGPEDTDIYSGKQADNVYLPEGSAIQSVDAGTPQALASTKQQQIEYGKRVYESNCLACHQSKGQGIPNAFPPLAKSDYLNDDPKRGIDAIVKGLSGQLTVNGKEYNGVMPAMQLNDQDIANVLTYILNSWGNKGGKVSSEDVAIRRH